jgi:hypothetical protein
MKKIKITKEQYNRITNLLKEEFPVLKKNIVDKTFKNAFANKNIKNLGEETDFNIRKEVPIKGVSKSGMGKFMKESTGDLKQETLELIKYLYRKTEEFSPFWGENNLTYDDICDALESKNLIIKKDGKFELSKTLGSAEEAKQAVENELSQMIGGEKEGIEEGDWFDSLSNHPANQPDPSYSKASIKSNQLSFEGLYSNGEIILLKDKSGQLYSFYYGNVSEEELNSIAYDLGFAEEEYVGKDEDGMPEFEYNYNWRGNRDEEPEVLAAYADTISDEAQEGLEAWENGVELVKIDDELKNELLSVYDKDVKLTSLLSGLNEENENERMARLKSVIAQRRADSQKQEDEFFKRRDTQNALNTANAEKAEKEMSLRKISEPEPEPKKPVGQYRLYDDGIDEMSSTGSVGGAFTPSLGTQPIKKQIAVVRESFELGKDYTHFAIFKTDGKIATGWDYSSLYDKYEKAYDDDSIKEYAREDIMNDFPENKVSDFKLVTRKYLDKKNINPSDTNNWYKSNVNEMLDVASVGNIGYDTPGGLTMDLGKKNPKTKAQKTPQWAGGEFVEQPECSKLNNNKEAQNGGCNTGASSLKTKKAKGSVNAPSLGEDKIYETIAKKTGKTIDEVKKIIKSKK